MSRKQVDLIKEIIYDSKQALPPLQRVEDNIRPFVHFGVLPLFALSNAGVTIEGDLWGMLMHPVSLGVIAGLVLGKFGGIFLISRALLATGLGELPKHSNWKQIAGLGLMAGIGFTMSLFIAELALDNAYLVRVAKLGILAGSLISGIIGFVILSSAKAQPAEVSSDPVVDEASVVE